VTGALQDLKLITVTDTEKATKITEKLRGARGLSLSMERTKSLRKLKNWIAKKGQEERLVWGKKVYVVTMRSGKDMIPSTGGPWVGTLKTSARAAKGSRRKYGGKAGQKEKNTNQKRNRKDRSESPKREVKKKDSTKIL